VHSRAISLPRHCNCLRNFSSETPEVSKSATTSLEAASSDATTTASLDSVVRHGPGDKVVCLDVGGKHFYTLRSTVAANPVLTEIVTRAEANGELTSNGHAVFVDRDPKHFQTILTYLRNKSEDLSYNQKTALKKAAQHVQLPNDKSHLADLYVEATYFQIEPLQDALCHHSIFTWAASAVSGKQNPFHIVSDILKNLRRVALGLTAGLGGTFSIGTLTNVKMPWTKSDDDDKDEREEPSKDLAPA